MSAQPLNGDIKIYRTIKSQRVRVANDSIAAIIKRLRPLVMSIPGHETLVGPLTRDTSTKDFSSYMGEARFNAGRGFPIVIGIKHQVSFAKAQTVLPDVDFAIQIGMDRFLMNTSAGLGNDLHKDARAITPDLT